MARTGMRSRLVEAVRDALSRLSDALSPRPPMVPVPVPVETPESCRRALLEERSRR